MSPETPSHAIRPGPPDREGARPWALEVFDHSLKKRLKLELLESLAGHLGDERCLLVTCGDNPGALNWHLREAGGRWTWAEMEEARIREIAALLGEPVHRAAPDRLPFPDEHFDLVVTIDVHEHLDRVAPLNREIRRVLTPGGRALVTTPSGNTRLPLARVKRLFGMTPEVYGHRVQGYTVDELAGMMREVGLEPEERGAYSRFFTEGIELMINLAYVRVLGRSPEGNAPAEGEIAPSSETQLESVGGAWRMYRRVYPVLWGISRLDNLLPGGDGYAVALTSRKPR